MHGDVAAESPVRKLLQRESTAGRQLRVVIWKTRRQAMKIDDEERNGRRFLRSGRSR